MQPCKAEALKYQADLGPPAWFIFSRLASSGGIYMSAGLLQPFLIGLALEGNAAF